MGDKIARKEYITRSGRIVKQRFANFKICTRSRLKTTEMPDVNNDKASLTGRQSGGEGSTQYKLAGVANLSGADLMTPIQREGDMAEIEHAETIARTERERLRSARSALELQGQRDELSQLRDEIDAARRTIENANKQVAEARRAQEIFMRAQNKWYDEWCLMENPYFEVHEMDCWPCSSVYSVQDLTGYNITPAFNTGIPFKRIEKMDKVDMNNLFQTYIKYKDSFDIDAEQGEFNQAFYRSIHDIMDIRLDMQSFTNGNTHIKWKINRMEPSRKIRELFPKLLGVPDWWSPSTEKFIFIDDPKSSAYELPNPECANVVILCTNGERLIDLNPSTECTQNCQKLSILLKAHQSLWYNWWYWRPISISSVNATATTITYFSSFC